MLRVELAKARIPCYSGSVQQPQEVPANVVGILSLTDSQVVVFVRHWYYWSATLSKPMPAGNAIKLEREWGHSVRVDGARPGISPFEGIYTYHVDTQDGLYALVYALRSFYGNGDAPVPLDECHARLSWIVPGSLRPVQAPGEADLFPLEFAALLSLAPEYGRFSLVETCYLDALNLAIRCRGVKSQSVKKVRILLANCYRSEAQRQKQLLGVFTAGNDRSNSLYQLERCQTERVKVLHDLGRHKEAGSVARDIGRLRQELIQDYEHQRAGLRAELDSGSAGNLTAFARFRYLAATVYLSKLLVSMGRHADSLRFKQEAYEQLPTLDVQYAAELRKLLAEPN